MATRRSFEGLARLRQIRRSWLTCTRTPRLTLRDTAGEIYLGFLEVTTDSFGQATFSHTLASPVASGQFITATATDEGGNTSEFSMALEVVPALIVDLNSGAENVSISAEDITLSVTKGTANYTAELDDIEAILVQGATDVEQFNINIDGLLPTDLPAGLWIAGGEGTEVAPDGDVMVIDGTRVITQSKYDTEGPESGTITLDDLEIHFTEFEPLIDNLNVSNAYSVLAHQVTKRCISRATAFPDTRRCTITVRCSSRACSSQTPRRRPKFIWETATILSTPPDRTRT